MAACARTPYNLAPYAHDTIALTPVTSRAATLCYHAAMQVATARCTRLLNIGEGRTRVWLQSAVMPQPGQFVLIRYWPGLDPYLSSAVFPAALTSEGFALEMPSNDPKLPYLIPGTDVQLTGPFGQPLPVSLQSLSRILLLCDRSPHRLLALAQQALKADADITLLLERPYPLKTLDERIEVRRGKLLTILGDYVDWAEKVFIDCLPELELRAALHPIAEDSYALFTKTLPCGTGACHGCPVQSREGWQLACVNGPFFRVSELD